MSTVNVHEAKTQLSRLLDRVAHGETIVIARAGTPIARLVPLTAVTAAERRRGFLRGQLRVPDDFDEIGVRDIDELFGR